MNFRVLILLFVFMLSNVLAELAFAAPSRAAHDYWRNTKYPGHYVLYDYGTQTYVETIECRVSYRFRFVSNDANTLTMFDASRNMTVQLNAGGMYLKEAGAANFSFYQAGNFDTRWHFQNLNPTGSRASLISKQHGCKWQEWFTGAGTPGYNFVEKSITNDAVEIYDVTRDMWVKMTVNAMYLRTGNAAYSFFHSGRWE